MGLFRNAATQNHKLEHHLVLPNPPNQKSGQIICIIGTDGGVGATTVAINLTASLVALDKSLSVLLTDINDPFGNVPLFLGIKSDPAWMSRWIKAITNIYQIDSGLLMTILYQHPLGFYVLPATEALNGAAKVTPKVLEKLLCAMRNAFDVVVIDADHLYDDGSLKILEMADTVLLVSILSVSSLMNIKRLFQAFVGSPYPIREKVQVIINRYQKDSPIQLNEVEQIIGRKIIWQIPNDYSTSISAINQGKPLSQVGARTEIYKSFRGLASLLLKKGCGAAIR